MAGTYFGNKALTRARWQYAVPPELRPPTAVDAPPSYGMRGTGGMVPLPKLSGNTWGDPVHPQTALERRASPQQFQIRMTPGSPSTYRKPSERPLRGAYKSSTAKARESGASRKKAPSAARRPRTSVPSLKGRLLSRGGFALAKFALTRNVRGLIIDALSIAAQIATEENWAKVKDGGPGTYDMAAAGFTQLCSGTPSTDYPFTKVVTKTPASFFLCAPTEEANFGGTLRGLYGEVTIPASQMVMFPAGNHADDIKGQNRAVWYNFGTPAAIAPIGGGSPVVIPIGDGLPQKVDRTHVTYAPKTDAKTSGLKPYQTPAQIIEISPSGIRRSPDVHNRLPPHKNESKKKFLVSNVIANVLYGPLTEVRDVVNCLQKAVETPKGHKLVNPKVTVVDGPNGPVRVSLLQDKIDFVYNNRDNINWGKAAQCIAYNHYEDKLIGKANAAVKKGIAVSAKSGFYKSPVGVGFGGFSQRMR